MGRSTGTSTSKPITFTGAAAERIGSGVVAVAVVMGAVGVVGSGFL